MYETAFLKACLLIIATQQVLSQTAGPTLKSYCPHYTFLGNGNRLRCASSWTYKGVTYNDECTTADHFRPWCSVTEGLYQDRWGNCDTNANCASFCTDRTDRGSASGAGCFFPFSYMGISYPDCTSVDHFTLWCATTPVYIGQWGNCVYDASCGQQFCEDRTVGGTASGAPCVFPFNFQGTSYSTCTTIQNAGRSWCSTTANYIGSWGNCLLANCPPLCTGRTELGTAGQAPCIFPFTYKGLIYTQCTTIENNGRLWCSTDPVYIGNWGNCVYATLKDFCPDRTVLGNAFGRKCASSYIYRGVTYTNECTRVDHFRFWCSTTEGAYAGQWGNCEASTCPTYCNDRTSRGNANGGACTLPFTYNGVSYDTCTTRDHFTYWCSTTAVFGGQWGNCVYDASCAPPLCTDRTEGGSGQGAPCVIPFTYMGVSYSQCTSRDHNKLWCSTTAVYNGGWGNCLAKDCPSLCTDRTSRGSANGAACVLPFSYQGVTYSKCTGRDHFTLWCSTTATYTGQWGNCVYDLAITVQNYAKGKKSWATTTSFCADRTFLGSANGAKCASSYVYKGVTYSGACTNRDHFRFWCSTTEGNFNGAWGNCAAADCPAFCDSRTARGTARNAACQIPFTYRGVTYNGCTTRDHSTFWCSTTATYSDQWGNCVYDASCAKNFCSSRTVGGTADGAPCVTPFTYRGVSYNQCTGRDHNRLWCSTTSVFNGGWGNCLARGCPKFCSDRTEVGTGGNAPCVFPFSYLGTMYSRCTVRDNRGVPWCSTTTEYTTSWGRCVYQC